MTGLTTTTHRCHIWQLFTILLFSVCHSCQSFSAAIGYKSSPGRVYVLENSTLTLNWEVDVRSDVIMYCYWKRSRSDGIWFRFLDYDNKLKQRLDYTSDQASWQFQNEDYPCTSGLTRRDVPVEFGGTYQMCWIDGYDYSFVALAEVIVIRSDQVKFTVDIGQNRHTHVTASVRLQQLSVSVGEPIHISISQQEGLPPSNVTIFQQGQLVMSCHMISQFKGYVSFEREVSNGNLTIEVKPWIDGMQGISVYQPVSASDPDKSHQSGLLAGFVIFFLLFLVVVVVVLFAVWWLVLRWRNRKKDNKSSNIFCGMLCNVHEEEVGSSETQSFLNPVMETAQQLRSDYYDVLQKHEDCLKELSRELDVVLFVLEAEVQSNSGHAQQRDEATKFLAELRDMLLRVNRHLEKTEVLQKNRTFDDNDAKQRDEATKFLAELRDMLLGVNRHLEVLQKNLTFDDNDAKVCTAHECYHGSLAAPPHKCRLYDIETSPGHSGEQQREKATKFLAKLRDKIHKVNEQLEKTEVPQKNRTFDDNDAKVCTAHEQRDEATKFLAELRDMLLRVNGHLEKTEVLQKNRTFDDNDAKVCTAHEELQDILKELVSLKDVLAESYPLYNRAMKLLKRQKCTEYSTC